MKRGVCIKCGSRSVAYLPQVEDQAGTSGRKHRVLASVEVGDFWSARTEEVTVEAYLCTACGYFEEYVTNVRQVPWNELAKQGKIRFAT